MPLFRVVIDSLAVPQVIAEYDIDISQCQARVLLHNFLGRGPTQERSDDRILRIRLSNRVVQHAHHL